MFKQLTRRILSFCLLGAMVLGLLPPASALAAVAPDPSSLRICVISDAHYYPLTYVSDCPDYQNYIGADPKLLAESGAILDEAMAMIAADQPPHHHRIRKGIQLLKQCSDHQRNGKQ